MPDRILSNYCLKNSYSGFEYLSGIPGSIGGAVYMNAGCYGTEVKDIFLKAYCLDYDGNTKTFENTSDTFSFNNANTYHRLFHRHDNNYGFRGYADQACFWEKELTDQEVTDLYGSGSGNVYSAESLNATGNFLCPAITAGSATTKMGAVITYQDQSGTNALNTDIVLQLSADGGSNYSTATLTALPDFSTGIKMAKVNDLAVTSGTSLKYKILFANQASGSKEARIRGVSLNY